MKPTFVKPDPIVARNPSNIIMKGDPMNYIDQLENTLERSSYITGLKTIANLCNGYLLMITRMRLKNFIEYKDKDHIPTIDDPEEPNETKDKELEEKSGITFAAPTMTLLRQGSIYASIRQECIERAANLSQMTEFDYPQQFKEYLETRILSLKTRAPTEAQIRAERNNTLGLTYEDAESFVRESNKVQAGVLEKDKEDTIACDSDYDASIDIEEALSALSLSQQHRLRSKMVDGLMYAWEGKQRARLKAPTFKLLQGQMETLITDALICERDMHKFEKDNKTRLNEEVFGTQRELVYPTANHSSQLETARAALKQRQFVEDVKVA